MASREEQEYSSQAPAPYIGQLLQQGIFPYAQKFMTEQFDRYGEAGSSPFTYTGQRVAGFDPRELYGMQLQDAAIGSYRPYLGAQAGLLDEAAQFTRGGMGRGAREITRGLGGGRGLSSLAQGEIMGATPQYGGARGGLGRAELSGYGSLGGFDPSGISKFYDPFEEDVVQQTLRDVREGLSKGDIALRDQAISSGAFGGARSRLRRGELAGDVARGATEAIGGIRSAGYQGARQAAQQAFEAGKGRQFTGGSGLAGFGGMYGGMAQAFPALQQQDVQSMMGMGGLGRGREQSLMDLNYQNFVGQYNLPMQTLQNVGSLTASLGPMAGGYGYAGATPASAYGSYTPAGGSIPTLPPPTGGVGAGAGANTYGGGFSPNVGMGFTGGAAAGQGLPSIYNQQR